MMITKLLHHPILPPHTQNVSECTARQHYVYLEDDDEDLGAPSTSNTLSSTFVNFPPYVYDHIDMAQVVVFESGHTTSVDSSNPCNSSTWISNSSVFTNSVVMIYYSIMDDEWCSVQQWTLQLEDYADVLAVLVVLDEDDDYVTELSGDLNLTDPTVPTRVISQYAAEQIMDSDDAVVTIGCWEDTEYPPEICLTDTSDDGVHVHLDGEFGLLRGYHFNDHPVWAKWGLEGVWSDLFMVLYVNQTMTGDASNDSSWWWMIVDDEWSVYAECIVPDGHPEHPAECGDNWHLNGYPEATLVASNETCLLGDQYLCVESTPHGGS